MIHSGMGTSYGNNIIKHEKREGGERRGGRERGRRREEKRREERRGERRYQAPRRERIVDERSN